MLGVFVGTFLYSLLVLRAVRAIGDPGNPQAEVFVPHLAVNGAVVLAVLDVAVLVYFIHHVAGYIQVSSISRRVREELRAAIEHLYPDPLGRDESAVEPQARPPEGLTDHGARVDAGRVGYVTYVEEEDVMDATRGHDVLLALQVRPGSYVSADSPLCLVHPGDRTTEDLAEAVRSAVVVSEWRSPHQDTDFATHQLTELAVRALSPKHQRPLYAAINALDDLTDGLATLAGRRLPSATCYDKEGVPRVHAPRTTAAALTCDVIDSVRWYATGHPRSWTPPSPSSNASARTRATRRCMPCSSPRSTCYPRRTRTHNPRSTTSHGSPAAPTRRAPPSHRADTWLGQPVPWVHRS